MQVVVTTAVPPPLFYTFYRFDISQSGSWLRLFRGQRSSLARVTARTSVFVPRQRGTWHDVINGYVDRVSVPYSDLSLIGCPCNRGFVPLVMYSPRRDSQTEQKGSLPRQSVLPRRFHARAEVKTEPEPVPEHVSSLCAGRTNGVTLGDGKEKAKRHGGSRKSLTRSVRNSLWASKALHVHLLVFFYTLLNRRSITNKKESVISVSLTSRRRLGTPALQRKLGLIHQSDDQEGQIQKLFG